MSDIASRVKAIIVDKLGVDENEVVTEASFTNDLELILWILLSLLWSLKKNSIFKFRMTKQKTSQLLVKQSLISKRLKSNNTKHLVFRESLKHKMCYFG